MTRVEVYDVVSLETKSVLVQWEQVHGGDEVDAAAPGTRSVLRPRPAVDGQPDASF